MSAPLRKSAQSKALPPDGFTVALDRRTRWLGGGPGGGQALLGGSPTRLLRLAPAARRYLPDGGTELTVVDRTSALLARRLLDAGVAHPAPKHGGPTPSAVTAVIPVKDRPDELRRLLAALAETTPGLAQVIVVDDGSADPAACREVAGRTGARLIRQPRSGGPAAARNVGLAAARTECVTFLDSDVVPRPGWLPPLLAHLADPSVALAAPRIIGLPAERPGWLHRYEQLRSALDLGPDAAPVLPRSRVAYVPSAALLVRRAALGTGFDDRLHVAEDVDLVLRLHAAGWRLRYEPAALVAHQHRADPVSWWTRKAFYGTGAAPLADRYPGSVPPAVLAPWTAAVCLLVAAGRRSGVLGAAAVTVLAWFRLRRTLHGLRRPGWDAARLVGLGLYGAASQAAGLLVRHWWPLTALGCLISRRVRRAAVLAALVEGLVDWHTHRLAPGEPGLDPVRYLLAHRADDLGYGAGLWWGAYRRRTVAPLWPVITTGGSSDLASSLVRRLRPSVSKLRPLLGKLRPSLGKLRPSVSKLRPSVGKPLRSSRRA